MRRLLAAARRNAGYKLLSVCIAVLLYYVAYSTRNPPMTTPLVVSPEIVGLPDDLVVREPPRQVTISVTGAQSVVSSLDPRTVRVTADASQARPGPNLLPLNVLPPPGVTLGLGPSDREVGVTLEPKKIVPFVVDPIFNAPAPAGYTYGEGVATPRQVEVMGPAEQVDRVFRVVARVEKGSDDGTITRTVALIAEDRERGIVAGVEFRPATVTVKVPLQELPQTKNLLLSAVFTGKPAAGYEVLDYDFEPSQVTVTGSPEALSSRSRLEVRVDVSGLSAPTTRTVTFVAPPGLRIQGDASARVRIAVRPVDAPAASPTPAPSAPAPATPRPTATPAPQRATPTPAPPVVPAPVRTATPEPTPTPAPPNGDGRDANTTP